MISTEFLASLCIPAVASWFRGETSGQAATSPMILVCPLRGARAGHDCKTASGVSIPIVHVERIKAAAYKDAKATKKRAK